VTPVLFDSRFFWNCHEYWHRLLRIFFIRPSQQCYTHSLGFVSFRLFLFMFISAWAQMYLPCSTDNCLQNAENAVRVSATIYSKVPKTKSYLFFDIWVQTCAVKYYLGEKNIVINCIYILFFFTVGSYWPHGTVNVTFHGTRAGLNIAVALCCFHSLCIMRMARENGAGTWRHRTEVIITSRHKFHSVCIVPKRTFTINTQQWVLRILTGFFCALIVRHAECL